MRYSPYSGPSEVPQYKVLVDMTELREQFYNDVYHVDPGYDHSGLATIFNDLVAMALAIPGHDRMRFRELPKYFSSAAQVSGDAQRVLDRTWISISSHASRVEKQAMITMPPLAPSRAIPTHWVPDLVTLYYEPLETQPQPEEPVDDQPMTEEEIVEEEEIEAMEEELQANGINVNPADSDYNDNVSDEMAKRAIPVQPLHPHVYWSELPLIKEGLSPLLSDVKLDGPATQFAERSASVMTRNMRSIHDVADQVQSSDEDLAQRLVAMGTQELAGESERADNDPLGMGQRKF